MTLIKAHQVSIVECKTSVKIVMLFQREFDPIALFKLETVGLGKKLDSILATILGVSVRQTQTNGNWDNLFLSTFL